MIMALVTEAFTIRSILFYALGGALFGLGVYLAFTPFDPSAMTFRRRRPPRARGDDRRGDRRGAGLLGDRRPACGGVARICACVAAIDIFVTFCALFSLGEVG